MSKFYIISDVGPGFDGVVVEGEPVLLGGGGADDAAGLVEVLRFIDTDSMLGDRHSGTPVAKGSILIDEAYLTEVTDPKLREFDSKNPYGKYQLEGTMVCGPIKAAYAQYERALTVNVTEKVGQEERTRLVLNFTNPKVFDEVKGLIESSLKDQDDAEQLVFKLQELSDNG